MNKLFLTGLAGLFALGAYAADPVLNEGAQMEKLSPNGKWAVGATEGLASYRIWNLAENTTSGVTNFILGKGNAIADNGTVVGYFVTDVATSYAVINGNKVTLEIPSEGTTVSTWATWGGTEYWPQARLSGIVVNGISKDATKVVGYGAVPGGFYESEEMNAIKQIPFIADLSSSGTLSNFTVLPMPNYVGYDFDQWKTIPELAELDVFGGIPNGLTAQWISEDGNTIVGMVSDGTGSYFYPVVWKKSGSSWADPIFPTAEKLKELPEPMPSLDAQDPMLIVVDDPYNGANTWDPTESPLLTEWITTEENRAKFFEKFYNADIPYGPWDAEEIEDCIDEGKYEAFVEALDNYRNWTKEDGGYWKAVDEWALNQEIYFNNNPFFGQTDLVVNPEGSIAACTQIRIDGDPEDPNVKKYYTIYKIDLQTGDYEKFDSKYDNLYPSQVLNSGDILASNDGQSVGYVRRTDANDFIPVLQYLKATNPDVAEWMKNTLAIVEVSTGVYNEAADSFFSEWITATGVISMTEDRTVIVGGVNNEEAQAANDDDPQPVKKQSYYLTELGTEIVAAPEGEPALKSGTNVPGLNEVRINWDHQFLTVNDDKISEVKAEYVNGEAEVTVGLVDATVKEVEMGYELVLSFEENPDGGDVTITIPEDLVDVDCWGLGTHGNAAMTINYHVAAVLPVPTVDPEGGTVTELPTTITLTWPEGVSLSRTPNAAYTIALLHNGEELSAAIDESVFSDNVLTVTLYEGFEEPGAYTLAVSAGYGTDAETGDMTPEVKVVYHLVGAVAHVSVSPQNGATLSEDAKVVVTWHDVVALHPDAVNKPTVSANVRSSNEIEPVLNGNNMEFDLSHLENGRYTLEIPEMYVTVGNEGYWNDVVSLVYTIDAETTGVGSLENENDGYRVYNLQGVNVLNTYNASDLNSLAPGIYVVNGKKVVIK